MLLSFFGDLDGLGNVESSMSEQQLRYREGILEALGTGSEGADDQGFPGFGCPICDPPGMA